MECGTCTLCCKLLFIKELNKQAGTMCKYCENNCSIYKDRPQSCKEFLCSYIQMNKASESMRPDNFGVIFEKLDDDLMFGTVNPEHKDFKHLNGQINSFLKEGINVVLVRCKTFTVYHIDNVPPESLLKRVHSIASD